MIIHHHDSTDHMPWVTSPWFHYLYWGFFLALGASTALFILLSFAKAFRTF